MKRKLLKIVIVSLMGVLMLNSLAGCSVRDILEKGQKSDTLSNEKSDESDKSADNLKSESNDKSPENTVDNNESSSSNNKNESSNASGINSPLSIGKTGITSIRNSETSGYSDVSVTLAKVTRGSEADSMVEAYNNSNKAVKVNIPKKNECECAVAELDVTIPDNLKVSKYGIIPNIDVTIKGLDGKNIKYNGKTYIGMNGFIISNKDAIKPGQTAVVKFAFPIPKGCTDYLIIVGNDKNTQAFFKGE